MSLNKAVGLSKRTTTGSRTAQALREWLASTCRNGWTSWAREWSACSTPRRRVEVGPSWKFG